MIDHERRFVFVHVPKTAGMSLYAALGADGGFGHRRLSDHAGADGYFSFGFVRNPWDRVVSVYHYLRAGGRGNEFDLAAQAAIAEAPTFEAFMSDFDAYRDRLGALSAPGWGVAGPNSDGVEDRRFPHLFDQTVWTHDGHDAPVLDFVGRYEELERGLAVVADRIGSPLALPRENASDRDRYRSYYNRRSRKTIAAAYAADIDAFEYRY